MEQVWDKMTNEELCVEYQNTRDDNLFEYFVKRNSGLLLYKLEGMLKRHPENKEILENLSRTAMWISMLKFDITRDYKFTTYYMANRLMQFREYRENEEFDIHLPEHKRYDGTINNYLNMLQNDSLDRKAQTSFENENENTIADLIVDDSIDLDAELENKILKNKLEIAIKQLSPREQIIIMKRFGLMGEKMHTLEEIGKEYGVTRERIRQLEVKALIKLKKLLKNKI